MLPQKSLLEIELSEVVISHSNIFYTKRWLPMLTIILTIFSKHKDIFHFNLSIVSFHANLKFSQWLRLRCWIIVIEHDSINDKNGIKFKLKCCKMYNISLITIKYSIDIILIINLCLFDIALYLLWTVNLILKLIGLYAITWHSYCIVTCSNLIFYYQFIHKHLVYRRILLFLLWEGPIVFTMQGTG